MKEFYYELKIQADTSLDLFIDLVDTLLPNAIEEGDNFFIIRSEDELSTIEYGVKEFAKAMNLDCSTLCEKKKNEDWIKKYQESVKAIEVSKFYIRPSWVEKKEDLINIIIDPALSFGSGHHETTNACLEAISKYVKKDDEVLDVGCGSGILSIAAAKLEAKVDICDTDENCIKDSEVNFSLNKTKYNKAWVGSSTFSSKKYDVVIANIVADVLIMISKDLKNCLKSKGTLVLSGILDKHLTRVLKKFEDLEIEETIHKNEWCTVVLKGV